MDAELESLIEEIYEAEFGGKKDTDDTLCPTTIGSEYFSVYTINEYDINSKVISSQNWEIAEEWEDNSPMGLWCEKVRTTLKKIKELMMSIHLNNLVDMDSEYQMLDKLSSRMGIWEFTPTREFTVGIAAIKVFPAVMGASVVMSKHEEFLSLLDAHIEQEQFRNERPHRVCVFLLSDEGVSLCNRIHKKLQSVTLVERHK